MTDQQATPETPQRAQKATKIAEPKIAETRADLRAEKIAEAEAARADLPRTPDGAIIFPPRDKRVMDGANESRIGRALEVELDTRNYEYRWANDDAGRIPQLQERAWETVSAQKRVATGLNRFGEARHKVLMRKPKPYWIEDQRARTARDNALIKGKLHDPLRNNPEIAAAGREAAANGAGSPFYVPDGARNGGGDYGYRP
jgi:hypothetical protein